MKKKKEYDPGLMGKAISGLGLRVLVSGYIVYMAWKVLSGSLAGSSPIPDWGAWAIFSAFVLATAAFCLFSLKQFLLLMKAADISTALQSKSGEATLRDESSHDDLEK